MSNSKLNGMQPDARESLVQAMQQLKSSNIPFSFNSGYRDPAEQKALYARYLAGKNPYPVAPPGHSNHERGLAADLGIAPQHRDAANSILEQYGWHWHGPTDAVHYDYKGSQAAPSDAATLADQLIGPSSQAGQALGAHPSANPAASLASQFLGPAGGQQQPQAASASDLAGQILGPVAGSRQPSASFSLAQPEFSPADTTPPAPGQASDHGLIGNTIDYWKDWASNTFGLNGNSAGQRLNYLAKPLSDTFDLANQATGGAVAAAFKPYNFAKAGVEQALNQENLNASKGGGFLGAYGPAGRSAIWNSMLKGWSGEPDPTLSGGIVSNLVGPVPGAANTPGLSPLESGLAQFASGALQDFKAVGDIAAEWELGGRYAHTFFKPIISGSSGPLGEAVRAMADQAGNPESGGAFARAARLVEPLTSGGVGGATRAGLEALNTTAWKRFGNTELGQRILPTLQAFAKTGADYRAGLNAAIENTALMRSGDSMLSRVNNMITSYSKKLSSTGVNVLGNALEGTEWDLPELNGKMNGNLVGQLVTLYKEAGSQGSFLSQPEVLRQATVLGMDPTIIGKIGDEAKSLDMLAGEGMVKAGIMKPDVLADQAGTHTFRSYKLPQLTKSDASAMAQDLAAQGHANTPLFALVQNVSENGGAERGGTFASPPGLRDIVKEREILTPEERLARIPDLDYTKSTRSIRSQFQEIAKANTYKAIADPQLGLSLANQIASPTWLRQPVEQQARFQGELARNAKQIDVIKTQFDKPGGINDTHQQLAGSVYKAAKDAQAARAAVINHEAAEPLEPEMPKGTTPLSAKRLSGGALTPAKGNLSAAAANRGAEAVNRLVDQASLNKYAADLKDWQKQHASWRGKLNDLGAKSDAAAALVDKTQAMHDAHVQSAEALDQKAGDLIRRNELLSGKRPATADDADQALLKAAQKVDPTGSLLSSMPPAVRAEFNRVWLDHWQKFNDDIWHDIPPKGLPYTPTGLDPKVIEAMGSNNPLIAAALNPNISVPDGAITAAEARARGMTQWGSEKGDYGPMEGRWASAALKNFLDDAMDPRRFTGDAKGATAGISKFFGEMMRSGKLYLNPVSHMNVFVQSIADNMMTAADAGKVYNPLSDKLGRSDWHAWANGNGPVTATVKAILDFGNEMAGGARHGVDPFLQNANDPLGQIGQNSLVKSIRGVKDWARQKFVDEQILPKAGLVRVLLDQGMSPTEAAMWAEKAHGGAGADMGGIETPGLMHLAENLNRNGVAMFTSYPLHSISRLMEMMTTRPDLVARWPLLRGYLVQQSSPEMQAQSKQHNLEFSEVPLPTNTTLGRLFANPNGSEGVINLSNAIPYGGAFSSVQFPNLLSPFTQSTDAADRAEKSGLNPVDTAGFKTDALIKGFSPGTITAAMKLWAASQGRTPTEGATIPQTVPQALTAFAGLPMRNPETGMSRALDLSKERVVGNRERFMNEMETRYSRGLATGEPDMTHRFDLRNMDPEELDRAATAAQNELGRLITDRAINNRQALGMIRNQMGYIHSLMHLASKQGARLSAFDDDAIAQQGAQQ